MMKAFRSTRGRLLAERSGLTARTDDTSVPGARRHFIPRVSELETRQLLSQLVVTTSADSGPGSLRAEIGSATPGDVITFARSLRGQTIMLASPLLVDTSLTIRGFPQVGPKISGNGVTEIMQVSAGAAVKLAGLTITNGQAAQGGAIDNSGGLTIQSSVLMNNQAVGNASTAGMGGAIYNEPGATLSLVQSRLLGNQALDQVVSGGTAFGGAVQSASGSSVLIRGSIFKFNQATSNQGPNGRAAGGAIADSGATLSIATSTFASNTAMGYLLGESGAIHNLDGTITISSSFFANNTAIGTGPGGYAASGAITNVTHSSGYATMTIRGSSFTGNRAIAIGTGGDGVDTLSAAFGGAMGTSGSNVIVNVSASNFVGNQAIAAMPSSTSAGNLLAGIAVGGAIENDSGAIFNLRSSVVTGNRALGGASGANGPGGAAFGGGIGSFMGHATLNVTNTVLTGNLAQGGGGTFGDGSGGGIAVFQDGQATLSGITLAANRAIGGTGAGGSAGSAGAGGALFVGLGFASSTPGFVTPDASSVAIRNSVLTGNSAIGGAGNTAGDAVGGAIDLGAGTITLQSSVLGGNTARGGQGSTNGQSGNGSGGGAFAGAGTTFNIQTSSIVGNLAAAGPLFMGALGGDGVGGGLYIQSGGLVFLNGSTLVVGNRATTQSSQIYGTTQD
jgi:hypothetical protein